MRLAPLLIDPTHRHLINMAEEDARSRLARLTPAERLVMSAMVDGKLNKNIAWDLGNSQRTIENHRARILEKTEVNSVVDLLRLLILSE